MEGFRSFATLSYRLIHIGQFFNDLGAPVAMGAPPLVSSTWFPPNQRATATAISTLTSYIGISVSFVVAPFILDPKDLTSSFNASLIRNISSNDSHHGKSVIPPESVGQ